MHRYPEFGGFYAPCAILPSQRDADTVAISLPDSIHAWQIRLIGCNCPEVDGRQKAAGLAAKQYAEKLLRQTEDHRVWIPLPKDGVNLLSGLTFDRVPGFIFLGAERTLNELLLASGHARFDPRGWIGPPPTLPS